MTNFYQLLQKIYQKPGVYIGTPSVSNLYMFLCGYGFSRQEQGLDLSAEEQEFELFQAWIQQRFQITASVSWAKIILLHSTDEQAAFDLFFELLTEFIRQQHPQGEVKAQWAIAGFEL